MGRRPEAVSGQTLPVGTSVECALIGPEDTRVNLDCEKTALGTTHITRDGRDNNLTPAAAIASFHELAAIGIDQAIVNMPNVTDLEPFDLLATEIIPAVEQIEVAGR